MKHATKKPKPPTKAAKKKTATKSKDGGPVIQTSHGMRLRTSHGFSLYTSHGIRLNVLKTKSLRVEVAEGGHLLLFAED